MIKKVLLIDIPTYEVTLPDLHRIIIKKRLIAQASVLESKLGRKIIRPSLNYSRGVLSLAACLERDGFSVKYINYSDPIYRPQIFELVKEVDVVGISALTPTIHLAQEISNKLKQINPKVTIILGGPHISACPDDTLAQSPTVDYVMVGECEDRLPRLLKSINNPTDVAGTYYRDEHGIIHSSLNNIEYVDVPNLPLPAYHLLNRPLNEYAHNIKTARGCPYQCSFCVERFSWHNSNESEHTIKQVIDEVKVITKLLNPGTLIHFSDAIFNLRWERTHELIKNIQKLNLNCVFSLDTRVDLISEEQIRSLSKANFVYFRMGFESVQNRILNISHKSISLDKQLQASHLIRSVGDNIGIHAYMITGLPGSTLDTVAMDAVQITKMIDDNLVDIIGNKIFVPYPGSQNYIHADELGMKIVTRDWKKYDRRSFPVYNLNGLNAMEIYLGYLLQEVALTEAYVRRLKGVFPEIDDIRSSLDYLFKNYADNSAMKE